MLHIRGFPASLAHAGSSPPAHAPGHVTVLSCQLEGPLPVQGAPRGFEQLKCAAALTDELGASQSGFNLTLQEAVGRRMTSVRGFPSHPASE